MQYATEGVLALKPCAMVGKISVLVPQRRLGHLLGNARIKDASQHEPFLMNLKNTSMLPILFSDHLSTNYLNLC